MKIADLEVIRFRVPRRPFHNGEMLPERITTQTLTKMTTDDGAEGYYFGRRGHGDQDGMSSDEIAAMRGRIRSMVVGQDPFDREKFWHWMWVSKVEENQLSVSTP